MGKRRLQWALKILIGLVLGILILGVIARLLHPLIFTGHPPGTREKLDCMNHLRQLGGLLLRERGQGRDIYTESGSRFLLQLAPKIGDGDLRVFLCPGECGYDYEARSFPEFAAPYREDWRTAACSYRGPDAWLLNELRTIPKPEKPRIIACDMNGPEGDDPHHAGGIVVLDETGRIRFLRWDRLEGSDGDPVPVGPDSPDPRLRHLVP